MVTTRITEAHGKSNQVTETTGTTAEFGLMITKEAVEEGHGADGKFGFGIVTIRVTEFTVDSTRFGYGRHSGHGGDGSSTKFGLVITKAAGEGHGVDGEFGLGMVTTEATELKDSTGSSTRLGMVTTRVTDSTGNTAKADTEATKEASKIMKDDGKLKRGSQRGRQRLQLSSSDLRILTQAEML